MYAEGGNISNSPFSLLMNGGDGYNAENNEHTEVLKNQYLLITFIPIIYIIGGWGNREFYRECRKR